MSRLKFSSVFEEQYILIGNVKAKHDADGAASVLNLYLSEKDIDLTLDELAMVEAQTHETNRSRHSKDAETFKQHRDINFAPVKEMIKPVGQFLKNLLAPNTRQLGLWGLPVKGKSRLDYPASFTGMFEIFKLLKQKHDSFPAGSSPLQPYLTLQGIDLNALQTKAGAALNFHLQLVQAQKDAENERQQRDLFRAPVVKHLRDIGGYLKKLYTKNFRAMELYGFTVVEQPAGPRTRRVKLKPASQKCLRGIVIGGTLSNTGTVPLDLYKGTGTSVFVTTVLPNKNFKIPPKLSVITVANSSANTAGSFTIKAIY